MENVSRALIYSVAIILFMASFTFGLELFRGNSKLIHQTNEFIYQIDREVMHESSLEQVPVSGHRIRHLVYHMAEMDADLVINGITYNKELLQDEIIVPYIPGDAEFDMEIIRDDEGKIIQILFYEKE